MMVESVVMETDRLILRQLRTADAEFILKLLNTPGWLRFIGDRGVHNADDAVEYLRKGPFDSYQKLGYGLWMVARKPDGQSIGMCGILKREMLEHPDIGFAFLPEFTGKGFATEAVNATLKVAWERFGISVMSAITTPDNEASKKVLLNHGFEFVRSIISEKGEDLSLFMKTLAMEG